MHEHLPLGRRHTLVRRRHHVHGRFWIILTLARLLHLLCFHFSLINFVKSTKLAHGSISLSHAHLIVSIEVFHGVLNRPLRNLRLQVRYGLLPAPEHHFLEFDMLFLIVFVNFEQLFVENLLGTPQVPPLIVIELYQQTVQIVAFEIDMKCVPLAVRAVVMEESLAVGIITRRLRHRHLHCNLHL